jgi:NPCBM/NEW2 domain
MLPNLIYLIETVLALSFVAVSIGGAALGGETVLITVDDGLLFGRSIAMQDELLKVDWPLTGEVEIPIDRAAGVLFDWPVDPVEQDQLRDKIVDSGKTGGDRIFLSNGDKIEVAVVGIDDRAVTVELGGRKTSLPVDRVRAISFDPALRAVRWRSKSGFWVRFANGSELLDKTIDLVDPKRNKIDRKNIVGETKPAGENVEFLSDRRPDEVESRPLLSIDWPVGLDRSTTGGRLRAAGQIYRKGIGVHGPSRLVYRLDGQYRRFEADGAIDDSAGDGGSVRFKVELDGKPVFESPIVRGGDRPVPISVDLKGAKQLTLIVEMADRLDQLDRANWLDARLIRAD